MPLEKDEASCQPAQCVGQGREGEGGQSWKPSHMRFGPCKMNQSLPCKYKKEGHSHQRNKQSEYHCLFDKAPNKASFAALFLE